MPRKSEWPPRVRIHQQRQLERVWWAGQWHYLGPVGSEEAKQAYAELLRKIAGGELPSEPPKVKPKPPGPLTVADVIARWHVHAEGEFSERGREVDQYRQALIPLERLFGGEPAADFDAGKLLVLREAMATGSWMTAADLESAPKRRERQGWCRKLVNQRIARIRAVWAWAELARLVPVGAFAGLKAVRPLRRGSKLARENPERKPATLAQVKQVCKHFPRHAPVLQAMLLLEWWSGARPGEVRTMRAGDVGTGGQVWVYRPRQHKTDYLGHPRVIPLGRKAQAVLRPWLARALEQGPDTHVFPPSRRRRGKDTCYTMQAYSRAVRRAVQRAGLPDGWCCYSTRHGAAQRIRRAAGDEAARSVLGHRTLSTTQSYGNRADHEYAADVARRLG